MPGPAGLEDRNVPTTRRRRSRLSDAPTTLTPAVLEYLRTGVYPTDHNGVWEVIHKTAAAGEGLRADWTAWRDSILADWNRQHPGTRPWAWWRFDAPRWQRADLPDRCRALGDVLLGRLAEPRRRLGGIGTNYRDGDFEGVAPDPHDPPVYESQAEYLRRHGLLAPAELKRLTSADFAPVRVVVTADTQKEEKI